MSEKARVLVSLLIKKDLTCVVGYWYSTGNAHFNKKLTLNQRPNNVENC